MHPKTPTNFQKQSKKKESQSESKLSQSALKLRSILHSESEGDKNGLRLFKDDEELDLSYCYFPLQISFLFQAK